MQKTAEQIEHDLLRPLFHSSGKYWVAVALATSLLLAGVAAFGYQLYSGIGVWGINSPVFWAFDITNFVFWIGISHAGTLISAILRLTNATWRRPVTRCAEAITVFSVLIGAIIPLCHIGRPWLAFWMIPYPNQRHIWPNFRSPLAWDFFAISTYLTGSTTFLFLPTIPDFAAVRDASTGLRKRIYRVLALGWQGTQRQWQRLEIAMHIMAIVIIPVAVSVHTIVSWDFAMTPVPMWHSSIFGPYFVAGAIFSGIAALILAMALLRKLLPTGTDFLQTLVEVSGRTDLEPYFTQAIYGTDVLDYSVDSLTSGPVDWWEGKSAEGPFQTSVTLRRKGTFLFPVKLEVGFEDGSKEQVAWDGKDRWTRFSWDKPSRAVYAQIDPDQNDLLDVNSFNNSYTLRSDHTARLKLTNYWVFTQQLLAQWLSFLV
jgi:Ni/Fe-hydrogenase subunit HybB-like protein